MLILYPIFFFIAFYFPFMVFAHSKIDLGIDRLLEEPYVQYLKGKKVGLITNHTGVDKNLKPTIEIFKETDLFSLVALFSPEHGIDGLPYAGEEVEDLKDKDGIPIYSLHGKTRRPTEKMLSGIEAVVFDIQEIGCRSYTYASTLFYAMEEAAKKKIPFIVLDRPNPMGGLIVDGPMLADKWRSFLGYINVPYCHGMTLGELAQFFNAEYKIGSDLKVVPMKGWKRSMIFKETGMEWIPPSPHIPEPDTPFFCASTGVLGELEIVNIGIGYTLPFKLVGAPWINAKEFAEKLNGQKLPGVRFVPYHFRPFYGRYKGESCHGVKIMITNTKIYRPLAVQYLMLGMLKTLYPKEFQEKLNNASEAKRKLFCQANGNDAMLQLLYNEKYVAWKLILFESAERDIFLEKRKPYLLYH
ncbi:MAG TPA: DUF1343 domain-containing protein [Rhabdochlamydiaceae bacterium]|nr:DUF1343 domain-containing protein [Rhabdochlamydiaceae bacterium]